MIPTTAAEALKLSKSGCITHINWNPLDRDYMTFNEDEKIWYNLTTPWQSASSLKEKNWIPYDPEPEVDQELEDAKKRFPVGSWFKYEKKQYDLELIKKVQEVAHGDEGDAFQLVINTNDFLYYPVSSCVPVWVAEPRCCVDQKPDDGQTVLVISRFGGAMIAVYRVGTWYVDGLRATWSEESKWYPLPPQGGK